MVEIAGLAQRIDIRLEYDVRIVQELEEVAAEWQNLREVDQASWQSDWIQFVGAHLDELDEQYRTGLMTDPQRAKYERLVLALRDALPTIRQLELWVLPVLEQIERAQ